jgi:hypothetical protein
VNPLACLELSKAVATSNRGARARHSPSGQPNASSAPLTKSFAQATRHVRLLRKRRLANLRLASRSLSTIRPSQQPCFVPYGGQFWNLSTVEKCLASGVPHLVRLGPPPRSRAFPSYHQTTLGKATHGRFGPHNCRPVKK